MEDAGDSAERDLSAEAFAACPLAIAVLDASGTIIAANGATATLLARPRSRLVGAKLAELAEESQREELAVLINVEPGADLPARREMRFVRPDGEIRVGGFNLARMAEPSAPGAAVVVAIRDVTDERALRESLIAAEQYARTRFAAEVEQRTRAGEHAQRAAAGLRLVIDHVPDLAIVSRHGRVVYVNDAAVGALGHDHAADLMGRPLMDLVHSEDQARVTERLHSVGAGNVTPPRSARMRRRDGSYLEVEVIGIPILFGGESAVLGLARDLTERKKIHAQLALSERLIALGTLAAGIAHEINNPLTYVQANLAVVIERIASSEPITVEQLRELEELLLESRNGAERIGAIVQGLHQLSRGETPRRAPVDIARVIEHAVHMTRHEVRHRARLVTENGSIPPIETDEGRLVQVLINLIINAAQSIPAGFVEQNEIRIVTDLDGLGRAQIDIRDSGSGIAPELLERIFEPFFTLKPVGTGTGLGLSISHEIITALGGTITVESTLGHGSVFRVTLPASRAEVAAQATPAAASGIRGRLLVIDDEPLIGSALRRMFKAEHDVVVLQSGRDALALLANGERFDVILCDLMMPDLTGMDTYAELVRTIPGQAERVAFMTGGAFSEEARAFVAGIARERIIDKPFDTQKLRALVHGALLRAHAAI